MEKVLTLCGKIDSLAAGIYVHFSRNADQESLARFWSQLAGEERTHVAAWNYLANLADNGALSGLFEQDEGLLKRLDRMHELIIGYHAKAQSITDSREMFTIACTIELYMLDPIFIKLFELFSALSPDNDKKIDYEAHIAGFVDKIRESDAVPELEMMAERLMELWTDNRALLEKSQKDYLTKLYNRQGFMEIVVPLCHLVSRNSNRSGIMMLDIDHFKNVNDSFGHQTGDGVLAELSRVLSMTIRKSDIAGRFGGEEFIVYLPDIEESDMSQLAEKIRVAVERDAAMPVPITISLGYAGTRHGHDIPGDIERLIALADERLYVAKKNGRNRVEGGQGTEKESEVENEDGSAK